MDIEDLRLAVYRSFANHGTCPPAEDLAASLDWRVEDIDRGRVGIWRL